jgi:cytochrome P450
MSQSYSHPFDRDLLTPEFLADPYRYYRQLREESPVFWSERLQAWVLTRYADVKPALHDPRLNSGDRIAAIMRGLPEGERDRFQVLATHLNRWVAFVDPPDHTRLRRLVTKAFTPAVMEDLRSTIQATVNELLDAVQGQAQFDIVEALAFPLPATVIAALLGIPPDDREDFKRWSNAIGLFVSGGIASVERAETAQDSVLQLGEYFHGLAEERRRDPADDLLSALVTLEEQGDTLSHDELISMCVQLLFAGHETTEGSTALGLLALFRNPDEFERLRREPALVDSAVEEILRYDTSVQRQARVLSEDMAIGGSRLRKSQYVLGFIAAANRDPEAFDEPDRFDIGRQPNPHMSFGHGIHYCLGGPLARVELQVVFRSLLDRYPNLRMPPQPLEYEKLLSMRKLKALVVEP